MKKNTTKSLTCLIIILNFITHFAKANMFPEDGSIFNQVHIMFECDDVFGAESYEINIISTFTNKKKVTKLKTASLTCEITSGLDFGFKYYWYYSATKNGEVFYTSKQNYFSILQSPQIMKDSFKTEISYTQPPNKDIIFLDYSAMAIDKKGNPVWFLPVNTDSLSKLIIRDIELSSAGTITYLDVNGAYEKDLRGKMLWKAPDDGRISGSKREEYHHEFKKINDGSYLICGSMYKAKMEDVSLNSATSIRYNTLIHYNSDGTIRWNWNELSSLKNDSIFNKSRQKAQGSHNNGFVITSDGSKIFMSFKNLSDVLLLNVTTGKFITSIKQQKSLVPFTFQQQHGPFLTSKNELMIYNNNITDKEDEVDTKINYPSVMIFNYNSTSDKINLVWEYEIHASKHPEGIKGKEGYVSETKAGNILICTGGVNYAAEVTRAKKKIWECYFYYKSKSDTAWKPYSNYRCQSASSLYPLYFTMQYQGNKKGTLSFSLNNAGSEQGIFEVVFSGDHLKDTIRQISKILHPGESQLFFIKNSYIKNKTSILKCRLTPKHTVAPYKDYMYNKLL